MFFAVGSAAALLMANSLSAQVTNTLANNTTNCTDMFVLDTPALVVSDHDDTEFTLKLSTAPSTNLTVFLNAPGLKFSACSLLFTKDNFASPQKVQVYPDGNLFNTAGSASNFSMILQTKLKCDDVSACTKVVPVTRKYTAFGGTCSVSGDPHFSTFDNKAFSYMGANSYYALKSDDLSVQVRHAPWGAAATVTSSIAVRYGNEYFIMDTVGFTTVDSVHIQTSVVNSTSPYNYTNMVLESNGIVFNLKTKSGVIISITPVPGSTMYINYLITVPSGSISETHGGLCNSFNAPGDTLYGPDKKVFPVADYVSFGNSWEIPAAENMFLGKFVGPVIAQTFVGSLCPVAPVFPLCSASAVLPFVTNQYVIQDPAPITPLHPLPGMLATTLADCTLTEKNAADMCIGSISGTSCPIVSDTVVYLTNCIYDVLNTCQLRFGETAKQAYMTQCAQITSLILGSGSPEAIAAAAELQRQLGLGQHARNCSAHGLDTPYGCRCYDGYTGPSCEVSYSDYRTDKTTCSGYGSKATGKCICDFGYKGTNCESLDFTPVDSNKYTSGYTNDYPRLDYVGSHGSYGSDDSKSATTSDCDNGAAAAAAKAKADAAAAAVAQAVKSTTTVASPSATSSPSGYNLNYGSKAATTNGSLPTTSASVKLSAIGTAATTLVIALLVASFII